MQLQGLRFKAPYACSGMHIRSANLAFARIVLVHVVIVVGRGVVVVGVCVMGVWVVAVRRRQPPSLRGDGEHDGQEKCRTHQRVDAIASQRRAVRADGERGPTTGRRKARRLF